MRVTTKGQVTIPVHIREKAGILPNTDVEFEIIQDKVFLKKAKKQPKRGKDLIRQMRGRGTVKMTTDEIMALTREE
ncbi:MAG: AbrB/MazE/SpoVT family DNA-binding domain-containing protein [Desulfobacterales bacterium]|jgi:AbrB family looped-hinge helix DNA binding protein|nr:AbrB/MazE/SpoVT family DNA-binding domain-containing protein [Desulfobacterales bacterium]